jgi:protein-tyrosine phosphatase
LRSFAALAMNISFVDIHCHLLPGIDDGAKDWDESLAMAGLAASEGAAVVVATPHQLGNFGQNRGDAIRQMVGELQQRLRAARIPLKVLPGADVRIESGMFERIAAGDVVSLGDHRRHVLLELPHELYLPLEPVIDELDRHGMVGILSHPERNEGILRCPDIVAPLVDRGCLMQVTAGSICGAFGPVCQDLSEWLLSEGLVHFVATDAHGPRSRRPLLQRAFDRVAELTSESMAIELFADNPAAVAEGQGVRAGRRPAFRRKRSWFTRKSAA